jgi:hypothetical protein
MDESEREELEARWRRNWRIAVACWVWVLSGLILLVLYQVPRSRGLSYVLGPICYFAFLAMCWLLVLETYWVRPPTFGSWLGRLVGGVVWMALLCLTLSVGVRILLTLIF